MSSASRLVLLLVAVSAGIAAFIATSALIPPPPYAEDRAQNPLAASVVSLTDLGVSDAPVRGQWPPRLDEPYPDLLLTDAKGNPFRLRDLKGKVILMELAAIPCKGCQAFAGGKKYGGFGGFGVQSGLDSIHEYAERYAGVELAKDDVVLVQLILYGAKLGAPTQQEVSDWSEHFRLTGQRNTYVLRGDQSMVSRETYELIPGFQLIDRDFTLRFDSSGHHATHDLYRELLPALGEMVRGQ